MSSNPGLPSGTVTFLFTDIEGSTRLLERLGRDRYENVLGEHSGIVRAAVASAQGQIVDTQGDSFFAVFRTAQDAVAAAVVAQRELDAHGWPGGEALRVRMGLHSAEPKTSGERYVGMSVHRAARIGGAAHGGQVLLSDATRALLADDRPDGIALKDLGAYRLKDFNEPVRLYQLVADGLRSDFPRPRSIDSRRRRLLRRRSVQLGLAAALALVVAGAIAGVIASSGDSAKPVRLRANSLAVFDPKTGKPVADLQLGFTPGGVVAGGNRIWVLNSDGKTATAIDPKTLRAVQTVALSGNPSDHWAAGDTEWVAMNGAVQMIGPSDTTTIPLWRSPPNNVCAEFVAGGHGRVWVTQGLHFAELDAADGRILRRTMLSPGAGLAPGDFSCYGVRSTPAGPFAVQDPDKAVGPFDPDLGSYVPLYSGAGDTLSATTQGEPPWTAGFGALWVGGNDFDPVKPHGTLTRIDIGTGRVAFKRLLGDGIGGLVVDPASGVWTLHPNQNTLRRIDPATGTVTRVIPLHHFPCCHITNLHAIAAGHSRIWVALQSP